MSHRCDHSDQKESKSCGGKWSDLVYFMICYCVFLPVPYPARVTMRALAMKSVTVVAVFTDGTHLLAVFTKEALRAGLITTCSIPASVAGDAASLCHLTGLLALAVPTPVAIQGNRKKEFSFILFAQNPSSSSKCDEPVKGGMMKNICICIL